VIDGATVPAKRQVAVSVATRMQGAPPTDKVEPGFVTVRFPADDDTVIELSSEPPVTVSALFEPTDTSGAADAMPAQSSVSIIVAKTLIARRAERVLACCIIGSPF
jgi:hypothetical protein